MNRRVAVLCFAVLLVIAAPAGATSCVVIYDPVGDATVCYAGLLTEPACPLVDPYLDSDPTVDITRFEIGSTASTDLFVEIEVDDLDEWLQWGTDKHTAYWVDARSHGGNVQMLFSADRYGDATIGHLVVVGTTTGDSRDITPVAFSTTSNTIRWEVSYTRLNEMLDEACPTCTDFSDGTTVTQFTVGSLHLEERRVARHSDRVEAWTTTYNLGD